MKKNLRQIILEHAFELFYEKGYDDTTISDIIERADVARGSFYYHFKGKEELLNSISELLDERYVEIEEEFTEGLDCFEKLVEMNARMHTFIEHNVPYNLMANLYSKQLVRTGGITLLDRNRYYFKLMSKLIEDGKAEGSITMNLSTSEISRYYSMCERALVTDWCMNNGEYSLGEYSKEVFRSMIEVIKRD